MIFIKTISDAFAHALYKCPVNSSFELAWAMPEHELVGSKKIEKLPRIPNIGARDPGLNRAWLTEGVKV